MPGPALSPAALAGTHPSLIGAGEWAASGQPKGAHAGNALVSGATTAPEVTGFNRLTGGASLPMPQPVAAPVAPPPPPPPPPPSGAGAHHMVGTVVAADRLSDAELKAKADRFEWVRNALGGALQKGALSHADILAIVNDGVKQGIMPAAEAGAILAALPTDPAQLRQAIADRHLTTVHALVHMAGEAKRREPRK